jgi:hypothetical protein
MARQCTGKRAPGWAFSRKRRLAPRGKGERVHSELHAGRLGSRSVVEAYVRETAYGFTSGYLSLSASTVSVYS